MSRGFVGRMFAFVLVVGLCISAFFWIDALFIPLVLLGPPITGVLAGMRRLPLLWIALVWLVAGLGAVISDWLINRSDVVFHVVLTVFVVGLAAGAWALAVKFRRSEAAPA
jgi:hypothetical protein